MYTVATLYKFLFVNDVDCFASEILDNLKSNDLKGTIIVAKEGLNGTIAGNNIGVKKFYDFIVELAGGDELSWQEFESEIMPFKKTKVKKKNEIVTLKHDLRSDVGEYIEAEKWDSFISNNEPILIDTRNQYEYEVGTFDKAISPQTNTFSEFVDWANQYLANIEKNKPIAMFCTGGIRCEKATKLVKDLGFKNVYHLKYGILGYLQRTQNESQKWRGSCFVFDERFSVDC